MGLEEGREYVKRRLIDDFNELTEPTKKAYESKYNMLMESVFVD
jgi:hypothetical protein